MPTTAQMLADYPPVLLQVLAELRGAWLDAADTREQAVDLLAAQITDPTSIQMAFEEVTDYAADAGAAIELLLKESGELQEAHFSRQFGSIRQMGPARLERETPWLYPESTSELLYYYGLIGRGFRGAGQSAHTVVYVPSDVTPWLPHPQNPAVAGGLSLQAAPAPPAVRTLPADDSFLEDAGTLLGFLHTDVLHLTTSGPQPGDVDRFVARLQLPFGDGAVDLNTRLALLLHLANRLGWLRRGDDDVVQLTGNRVRTFLDLTRAEQRAALWQAWCDSPDWNDLCRTPGLECADTGAWRNDPLQTRQALLRILAQLQPGAWYSLSDFAGAVKETDPDFQRPTGSYDTWYIRSNSTQEFLKGFEQWDAVEGALLRFLVSGPLHWLRAVDLAEPSSGDDLLFSLSQWGAHWLGLDTPQPHDTPRHPLVVGADFTVTLPAGTPLADRFRAERFAVWQASYPQFVYQISQRSLKRATGEGITPQKVREFLESRSRQLPERVAAALTRFEGELARERAVPTP